MLLWAMSLMCSTAAHADDQIRISGSSTVFPYSRLVADRFHAAYPKFKAPVVESGGSGAGIKEFCRSDAENSLDIANASRPMSESEYRSCVAAGVKDIQKITFGHDGIVLATNKAASDKWQVTPKDVYLALAKQIMKNNKLIPNPYTQWNEVNSKLPSWNIEAYIPGEKHGTREVFEEKMLLAGCKESGVYDAMAKQGMDPKAIKNACIAVRKDGKSVDIDGDYTETLSRLASNPKSVGFFGLAFYCQTLYHSFDLCLRIVFSSAPTKHAVKVLPVLVQSVQRLLLARFAVQRAWMR